ncbi:MAG: ribosomal protein S18-alanine N-acetyltransferase [Chloroflexota bacterium]
MQVADIPAVMVVEKQSFSMTWPANAYKREIKENRLAHYFVAMRTFPMASDDQPTGAEEQQVSPQPATQQGVLWLINRLLGKLAGTIEEPTSEHERSKRIVGYAGLWLMVDEAHITTIAVAPSYRGLGLGELLLLQLIDTAHRIGARYLTLEARVSNTLAQNLYRKYLFKETGIRRRYYSDNNEDAVIMWSDPLDSPGFQQTIEAHRRSLMERLRSPRTITELRARGAQT